MIAILLTSVAQWFFRVISFAAKIALNRVTVVIAFVALIGASIYSIYQEFDGISGLAFELMDQLHTADLRRLINTWAVNNEYLLIVGYALALDVFFSTVYDALFAFVITVGLACVSSVFWVLFYSAPLLADLIKSAMMSQIVRTKL